MADRIDEHNINQQLSAFADGELDAAQMARVLDYLVDHREALDELRSHQRFRASASDVLKRQAPPPSAALRARIAQIAEESRPPVASPMKMRQPALTSSWRWVAAAAVLLLGFGAGRWAYLAGPGTQIAVGPSATPVVPVSIISHAAAIHADCSRLAMGLHNADYPTELADLAASVKKDLGSDLNHPDLTSIDFIYRGAGPCGSPLRNTIHLLYRSKDPASMSAVSVFVQVNAGQFKLEEGKLYSLADARSPFPMLAWRTEKVVYFLIADNAETIEKARAAIAPAEKMPAPVQD